MTAARVIVFENANFQGRRLEIPTSRSSLPASFRNKISSIKTSTPVVLFSRSGYKGDVITVDRDTPSLNSVAGKNFNDLTNSALVLPIKLKLNIIVGAINGDPARSFELINEDIAETNQIFGPFGLRVDVNQLSVGGAQMHTPHSIETFKTERAKLRSDGHLNVTYINGGLYRPVSWRWRVRSIKVEPISGSSTQSATIYNRVNRGGNALRVRGQLATLPASHEKNVLSFALARRAKITVFSRRNFLGEARTFYNDVNDLKQYSHYFDWWAGAGARANGNAANWSNFDLTLQPGASRNQLAWGVAQALNISLGRSLTVDFKRVVA